jgi:hypothetical protein
MKKHITTTLATAISLAAILPSSAAYAGDDGMRHYAVTITNITRGQILAPAAVIAHNDDFKMFDLGSAASPELAMLAEEGSGGALLSMASSMPSVFSTAMGSNIIMPGESQTIEISTTGKFSDISVAAMLVSTNDGFMAIRGVDVPKNGEMYVMANAYDAGSEANTESCAYIPGPPCGAHAHDASAAEGYVHIHAGIHGIGGLNAAMYDWRGAVAQITIKRMN